MKTVAALLLFLVGADARANACDLAKEPLGHLASELSSIQQQIGWPWRRAGLSGSSPLYERMSKLQDDVRTLQQKVEVPPEPPRVLDGPFNAYVIPPPPPATGVLDGEPLDALYEEIARATFPADRLAVLAAAAADARMTTASVRRILLLFPIAEWRLRALAFSAPRIVDVQNLGALEQSFDAAHRRAARVILEP